MVGQFLIHILGFLDYLFLYPKAWEINFSIRMSAATLDASLGCKIPTIFRPRLNISQSMGGHLIDDRIMIILLKHIRHCE